MPKTDKIITDRERIDEIIQSCTVCRVGFASDNLAYILPLNFGYDGKNLYFHTAMSGKKIEIVQKNRRVCFEFDTNVQILSDENIACKWTCKYQSVVGYGQMKELTAEPDRIAGLNQIMRHYSGKIWTFDNSVLKNARIWKLTIDQMTGKESK